MMSDKDVASDLVLHYTPYLYNPTTENMISAEYFSSVQRFVGTTEDTDLENLHLLEAEKRGVTQFEMQKILEIQENAYNSGADVGENFIDQRTKIIDLLNLTETQDLQERGKRICGLALCDNQFFIIQKVSPLHAKNLLKRVTDKFGQIYYENQRSERQAINKGNEFFIKAAVEERKQIFSNLDSELKSFNPVIPKSEEIAILKAFLVANIKAGIRGLQESQTWGIIKDKSRNLRNKK